MIIRRHAIAFTLVAAVGFMTPWLVQHDWLAYVLGTSLS